MGHTTSLRDINEWLSTHERNHGIAFSLVKSEDLLAYLVSQHFLGLLSYTFCK